MKLIKKIIYPKAAVAGLLVMMVLGLISSTAVKADSSGNINITVTATNLADKPAVSGVTLSLFKVAEPDASTGSGYRMTDDFAGSGVTAETIVQAKVIEDTARTLETYAKESKLTALAAQTSDSQGKAAFSNLADGIYMIMQTNTDADFQSLGYTYTTDPFIVGIPSLDSNGKTVRNISCEPKGVYTKKDTKTDSLTVYKVWKDNNDKKKARPDSIQVGLYKDGECQEKVKLSAGNNWRYQWTDLSGDSKWTVKEISVPTGYTSTITGSDDSWTITNTYKTTTKTTSTTTTTKKSPKTGDQSNALLWIVIFAAAGVIIIIAGYVYVKKLHK